MAPRADPTRRADPSPEGTSTVGSRTARRRDTAPPGAYRYKDPCGNQRTDGALHAAGLGEGRLGVAETLDAVVLSDLGVEADGEATRVAAERGVVAAVAQEGKHGERHAERPGAIRGHDLDLLLRETRVVRDLDHLAGLDMIRLLAGSERGAPLPASRHLERLHVGDDAGDGRLLGGVRHPGCPGAGYALPVSRGASAPAESKILVREPDHGLSRRVVWRPPPYLPASAR